MTQPVAICSSRQCGQVLDAPARQCPVCGAPAWPARKVARLGLLLLVLGLLLAGGMAVLLYLMAPSLLHPGERIGGTRFTGTAGQGRQILWVLALIGLFGLFAIVNGAWQWATGRRNWPLMIGTFAMAALVVFMAWRTVSGLPS